ncbi:DUF2695 domain-containing protein [Pedobacter sp. PLR]|uniref:DUF2695 domain-containing protein n=1 Tax=Pedobacter sp. PLR TaxID=2994465 RepID=UPI002246761A|nr:DUF2695 domain-containing protein [Pedobacter sp. PLR]MCX2451107.1 DUF2695 domain-containing protein [Pedobacter sp. PLR]
MTDKTRRKQIRSELRLKAQEEFESSLPMSREEFKGLFEYLDLTLQKEECNDDHALTVWFLNLIGIENAGEVVGWLIDNNGFCDCETLANVEELFER